MTPEQRIKKILQTDPLIGLSKRNPNADIPSLKHFWSRLFFCLMSDEYHSVLHMGPIAIVLDTDVSGSQIDMLDPENLHAYLNSGITRRSNVVALDINGFEVGHPNELISNRKNASDLSRSDETNVFFINGLEMDVFAHGAYIDSIPNIYRNNRITKPKTTELPISEYRKLIQDHHNSEVYKQKGLIYWQNKAKRLLKPAPEEIFQRSLARYLRENVVDGTVDMEPLNASTADRNDVRVIDDDHQIYILELKWLGKSESISGNPKKYGDDKANEGIVQLNRYLKDDSRAVCGALVLYDGRDEDREPVWHKERVWDKRIDKNPMRFYLITESASKEGERIVKELKK